jgi:tetratricopeptide (TPR) repeat protein
MNSAEEKEVQKATSKARNYLIIAVVLLFGMALLSSLHETFLYILGGFSVFFLFLAWQNWRRTIRDDKFGHYNRSERGSTFADNIRETFRRETQAGERAQPLTDQAKRIIFLVASFIGGIFTLIILIIVFTSGSDESDTTVTTETSEFPQSADDLYSAGDYDAAYVQYRRNISENPSSAAGYYGIANIKTVLKERDSALFYYDKALAADPELFDAAYGKALIYFNEQNYNQSNEELRYIFGRNDQFVNAHLLAGDNYYFSKDYDRAIGYYETAYRLEARSKELANIMAYIYDVKGDQTRAIAFYKETLQYDSTATDVYKRLGELLPGEEGNLYRQKAETQW